MPLLDHFHPPLASRRHWEAFHGWWAAAIAGRLNDGMLPPEYFAEFQVSYGTRVEVDVATFAEQATRPEPNGPLLVQERVWAPPAPTVVLAAVFPDDIEVQVFSTSTGPTLVGAIELVSPGNKDREETRQAFASKCSSYVQRGIGLIVIDIVTSRHANLHDQLMTMLGHGAASRFTTATPTYATAYRPVRRQEDNQIELWREPLALGQTLPTLPLAVRGLATLPIDLEGTYTEACRRGRIG